MPHCLRAGINYLAGHSRLPIANLKMVRANLYRNHKFRETPSPHLEHYYSFTPGLKMSQVGCPHRAFPGS